ncbi:MAG: Gmad2 immunoglobulin-like domain-containing protein [Acidimicrobiales bacterium]
MTPEDRLRAAITARTSLIEPPAETLDLIEEKLMRAQRDDVRSRWLIGVGAAAAAIALVVGVLAITGDDDTELDTANTTTTTTQGTSSTETTTSESSTTETTSTTTLAPTVDPASAVFPDPATSRRFDSPEAVAAAFARDFVGMTDPVVGTFAQGDSRSGEVEVRGFATGEPTVVLVRQLEDDTWFVIGAVTDSIQPATPEAGATISSPQSLTGAAYAFEGTVGVQLFADGAIEPIATTFVTGRGDGELGDYTGDITFTVPGGARYGVLLYASEGGEDGAPIAATAVRVRFG